MVLKFLDNTSPRVQGKKLPRKLLLAVLKLVRSAEVRSRMMLDRAYYRDQEPQKSGFGSDSMVKLKLLLLEGNIFARCVLCSCIWS